MGTFKTLSTHVKRIVARMQQSWTMQDVLTSLKDISGMSKQDFNAHAINNFKTETQLVNSDVVQQQFIDMATTEVYKGHETQVDALMNELKIEVTQGVAATLAALDVPKSDPTGGSPEERRRLAAIDTAGTIHLGLVLIPISLLLYFLLRRQRFQRTSKP